MHGTLITHFSKYANLFALELAFIEATCMYGGTVPAYMYTMYINTYVHIDREPDLFLAVLNTYALFDIILKKK